ncbi:MAG TPA: S66 peptidase family protein, partial [Trueperaceae bacterium]
LSSGAAASFPHVYRAAKRNLADALGLHLIETPNALQDGGSLYRHPEARADDLHWALTNPEVKGIFSTIGGYESVRVLPYVDAGLIRDHPKILLGFSDTTSTHTVYLNAGVVSFYGPSLMAGIADLPHFPYTRKWLHRLLIEGWSGPLEASAGWTESVLDWGNLDYEQELARPRMALPSEGWRWLQGEARAEGQLMGGCVEVLEMLKGTRWWPDPERWRGAILCLETSEEVPPPSQVEYWLRNYASQGILAEAAGLLFGRPRGYTADMTDQLYGAVRKVVREAGREDMPVVADMDFGHTSPMMVLPLGCRAAVDPARKQVEVLEAGVI